MKKRNLILLPLLVLGSTGLSSLVTSCSKLPESVEFATDEAVVVKVGQPVELPGVTVLPEKAEDKTYSFALSSEGIVTLEEDEGKYILTGVAPGEVVITVTSTANPELKDTILVTVPTPDPLPTPIVKTVAEVSAMTATDSQHLYEVTGVVSQISHDAYGNMYLSTDDGSASIQVYGVAPDASCFDWTNYNYTNIKFTNPQKFITSGLSDAIDLGDVITLVCQFKMYNTTPEILGYVKAGSIVKSSTRPNYSATLTADAEKGTSTWVKYDSETKTYVEDTEVNLEKLYWGQKLLLKAVPNVSADAAIVKVNDVKIEPNDDGLFEVVIVPGAAITVSFEQAVFGLYELVPSTVTCGTSYGTYTGTSLGMGVEAHTIMKTTKDSKECWQMKGKDGKFSSIRNTEATNGNIVSVSVEYATSKFTTVNLEVIALKEAITPDANGVYTLPEDTSSYEIKALDNASNTETVVTVSFDAAKEYKYFVIRHNSVNTFASYALSFTVTTDAYTPAA